MKSTTARVRAKKTANRRVVIVEDHRLVAEFFAGQCREMGLDVVAICGDCGEALDTMATTQADLVLLDLTLPDGDGIELAQVFMRDYPETRILGVSSHVAPWTMVQVQRIALHGFVDKNTQRPHVLQKAIQTVLAGHVYYTPIVQEASALLRNDPKSFMRVLSDYETKILSMIGGSKTDAEIGVMLGIKPATAQSRRRDIMRKVDVHSTPKLIGFAIEKGITRIGQIGFRKLFST